MGKPLDAIQIKKVIDTLKEGPKTWSELAKFIPEKSLSRILKEYLEYWGLVYKGKDGRYSWIMRKTVFETTRDYELAIQHSKLLIFGKNDVGTDEALRGVPTGLGILQEFSLNPERHSGFFQHLIHGYPLLYSQFEEFDRLISVREKLIRKEVRKVGLEGWPDGKGINFMIGYDIGSYLERRQNTSELRPHKQKELRTLREYDKKLLGILKTVSGEIALILLRVRNGIPLDGYCDMCPHIRLTIKE